MYMTLEELSKALGIDGEEEKDKFAILKKEFNSKTKEVNTLNDKLTKANEELASKKEVEDKLKIIADAFEVDANAEDLDKVIEEAKDILVKNAGGGTTPDEVKALKRDLAKATRDRDKFSDEVKSLSEQLEGEKTMRISSAKRAAIQKALVDNKIIKPEQMIDLFFGRVNVDEDGTTMTMKGSDGSELTIGDAIADWAKDNPEFVIANAKGGIGSSSGANMFQKNQSELSDLMKTVIGNAKPTSTGDKSLADMFG